MGEFRISHVRITFGRVRWRDKKAGTRVVGWSPRFFFLEMGMGHPHIPTHPARRGDRGDTIPHSNAQHYPISPHIDEDALEGLYFAFSLILRCLPYFLRKTRPTSSYDLLEAFLPSCGECGAYPSPHPTTPSTIPHSNAPHYPSHPTSTRMP